MASLVTTALYVWVCVLAGCSIGKVDAIIGNLLGALVRPLVGGGRLKPVVFNLPPPPALTGPIAMNTALRTAEQLHRNQGVAGAPKLNGPASIVTVGEDVYVATMDNKIYNVARCLPELVADLKPSPCNSRRQCGQLTSIRLDPISGDLLALDSFRGLFKVNLATGVSTLIFSAKNLVNARAPVHLNDMVVTPRGEVIMSDSSDLHDFDNDIYIGMEGRKSGRLIVFSQASNTAHALPMAFVFPNGLELTTDGKALLVVETSMCRVLRVSFEPSSKFAITVFANNLPGLPDNIRASDHGTYWLAMHFPRHKGVPDPIGQVSRMSPTMRSVLSIMPKQSIRAMFGRWGMAVEVDASGKALRSLQDPKGVVMSAISEISDQGGVLNIGSPQTKWLARIVEEGGPYSTETYVALARSRCQITEPQLDNFRQMVEKHFNSTMSTVNY